MTKQIPTDIEIIGTEFRKSIAWTAVGSSVGSLLAGPVGGISGGLTQGNRQNFQYIIKFNDGSQKVFKCKDKNIEFELIVWGWRIANQKSETDYVDFGLNFSTLKRGMIISSEVLDQFLQLEGKSFKELWKTIFLEKELKELLKAEIERYFKEKRNSLVTVEYTAKQFKILNPESTFSSVFIILVTLSFAIFGGYLFWCAFFNPQKPAVESPAPSTSQSN